MRPLLTMTAALYAASTFAADPATLPTPPTTAATTPPVTTKQPDLSRLEGLLNGEKPDSVVPSRMPGVYEVTAGGQVFYLSEDGKLVLQGDLVDLETQNNLTEDRRRVIRSKAIAAVSEKDMLIFGPEGPVKHTVTVFTDIDCGYCRKLHNQMAEYNKAGIRVRYLMLPRAGIDSESYKKAVTVWCSANRQEAMTRAKRGENLEPKTCENPIQAHYDLAQKLGIQGTPHILLESGQMIPGYVPPSQLYAILQDK